MFQWLRNTKYEFFKRKAYPKNTGYYESSSSLQEIRSIHVVRPKLKKSPKSICNGASLRLINHICSSTHVFDRKGNTDNNG